MDTNSFDNTEDHQDDIEQYNNDTSTIALSINNIKIPDNKKAQQMHKEYCKIINAIESDKKKAFQPTCIVCQKQHTFDNCDTLNNIEFLKTLYSLLYCTLQRRKRTSKAISQW